MVTSSKIKSYSEKIEDTIKKYFEEKQVALYLIDVSASGISDNIHVVLVSDYFKNRPIMETHKKIYSYMEENLEIEPTEYKKADNKKILIKGIIAKISLFLTLTEEEYENSK